MKLLTFSWDPSRDIFVIPYVNHPITWYGFIFAIAFLCGYFFLRLIFRYHLATPLQTKDETKAISVILADRLSMFAIFGGLIGARLGHVFFYDWPYYRTHLLDILKVWEGGLASHGGAVGIIIAILIFFLWHRKKFPSLTFLSLLDAVVLPATFIGGCIRIGNFINQEILGTPTTLPWGVYFLHPVQQVPAFPLHPVQLYEAFSYFFVFIFLILVWISLKKKLGAGLIAGWFFVLVFSLRFFFEFVKLPQSQLFDEKDHFNMGQILSLPFIVLGFLMIMAYYYRKSKLKKRS